MMDKDLKAKWLAALNEARDVYQVDPATITLEENQYSVVGVANDQFSYSFTREVKKITLKSLLRSINPVTRFRNWLHRDCDNYDEYEEYQDY